MDWLKSHRFIIELCILVVGVVLLSFFLYLPKLKTSLELREELGKAHEELTRLKDQTAPYEALGNKKKNTEQKLLSLRQEFPGENEVPRLINEVIQSATFLNLNVLSSKQSSEISCGVYKEKSIEIQLEGFYSSLARFLGKITNFPKRLNITSLKIKSSGDEPDSETNKIVLSMTLNTVVYTLAR